MRWSYFPQTVVSPAYLGTPKESGPMSCSGCPPIDSAAEFGNLVREVLTTRACLGRDFLSNCQKYGFNCTRVIVSVRTAADPGIYRRHLRVVIAAEGIFLEDGLHHSTLKRQDDVIQASQRDLLLAMSF